MLPWWWPRDPREPTHPHPPTPTPTPTHPHPAPLKHQSPGNNGPPLPNLVRSPNHRGGHLDIIDPPIPLPLYFPYLNWLPVPTDPIVNSRVTDHPEPIPSGVPLHPVVPTPSPALSLSRPPGVQSSSLVILPATPACIAVIHAYSVLV